MPQVGLLVKTPYVAFLDDDSIPGSRFIEICMKVITDGMFKGNRLNFWKFCYDYLYFQGQ